MKENDKYLDPISVLMPPRLELVDAKKSMHEVIAMMSSHAQGCIFACETTQQSSTVSMLTEREILLKLDIGRDLKEYPLTDILEGKVRFHGPDMSCEQALNYLLIRDLRYLPILEKAEYSIIGIRDFFKWSMKKMGDSLDRYDAMKGFNEKAPLILLEDYSFLSDDEKSRSEYFLSSQISRLPLLPCLRVDINQTVESVLMAMRERVASACAVVEYETLLKGIVTERDFLMKIFPQDWNEVKNWPIKKFMTPSPHALSPKHSMGVAIQNFLNHRYRNLVIIDEDRFPIYILGVGDIFKGYLFAIGVLKKEELSAHRLTA